MKYLKHTHFPYAIAPLVRQYPLQRPGMILWIRPLPRMVCLGVEGVEHE